MMIQWLAERTPGLEVLDTVLDGEAEKGEEPYFVGSIMWRAKRGNDCHVIFDSEIIS